ncbi:MAG: FAD-binding oxidoreductase [Ardenticatenaceae bacterium]|nr:FAD-binding oxidoreductase [Ardenticatenaceae bacterium]MCB8986873.1 FAD-binding oxidoreductase [Ardenticatenaceae bacterium]
MAQTFDVIVIGGGIMGCSTAFQLAQRGLSVALLEKKSIGEGPSGKSSAIIRQHYSNELTARMAYHSLQVFQNFAEVVGGECGFTQCGFILVVDAKDKAGLEANIALQRRVGIETGLIPPEEVKKLMPGLRTAVSLIAAYEPQSGYADPYLTVTSYAQAARRLGVTIFQDTPVTGIRLAGGKVQGVDTGKGAFDAPLVLNCTGAWGAQVARLAGVDVPIDPCRVQVSFFRRPPGEEAVHPVVADFEQAIYFRPETGGLTLVGLIDPKEADAIVNPDRFSENVSDAFVLESGERLVTCYPALEESRSTGGYASLYAITPDWHPIVDELPPGSGLYVCSGFSGHGFKLGPAVGRMLADLVLGVADPLFEATMFRYGRFAANQPVQGQYEYSIVG